MDLVPQRLCDVIKAAQEALEEYRRACMHSSFTVALYSWRPGALEPQRICDQCGGITPGITEKEAEEVRKKFKLSSSSHVSS